MHHPDQSQEPEGPDVPSPSQVRQWLVFIYVVLGALTGLGGGVAIAGGDPAEANEPLSVRVDSLAAQQTRTREELREARQSWAELSRNVDYVTCLVEHQQGVGSRTPIECARELRPGRVAQ